MRNYLHLALLLISIATLAACGNGTQTLTPISAATQTSQTLPFPIASYLAYEQIDTAMTELASNSSAEWVEIGNSVEQRPLKALHIPSQSGQPAPVILMVAGLHPREWIAPPQLINLAQRLLQTNSTTEVYRTNLEIWIVPIANPDGYIYSWQSDRSWRKNRRKNNDGSFGVDLNRNFLYQWGEGDSSNNTLDETYHGPTAASEPETKALQQFIDNHNLLAVVDIHAYDQSLSYPATSLRAKSIAKKMGELIQSVHQKNYSVNGYTLPMFGGGLIDYANGVHNIDSYVLELRPNNANNTQECPWLAQQSPFAPPEQEIIATWQEIEPALIYLLQQYASAQ